MSFDRLTRFLKKRSVIHLDYASATPVAPEVLRAMQPYWSEEWANPSALYASGVRAREAVESARTLVARTLRIRPRDVVFTGSGTESNNLAILGLCDAVHASGREWSDMEVISTRIEHPSVLEVLALLVQRGVRVQYLALHEGGRIVEEDLKRALSPRTVLVTCSYVNSEIGVVEDVKRITRTVRAWNESHGATVRVHTDASQAPLWLSCAFDTLGVDLMTLDCGKCYGPKGVGILAMRHGVSLTPQLLGGGQEHGLRAATENTALIVGGSIALARAQEAWKSRSEAVASLRDFMFALIREHIPEAVVNGDSTHRVANNVNISIPGLDTEFAVITLDSAGICASTRSACGSTSTTGSHVVRAVTEDDARARATIRFTLGEGTTKRDISTAVDVLSAHVKKMLAFRETLADGAI